MHTILGANASSRGVHEPARREGLLTAYSNLDARRMLARFARLPK
jgi:hypothetical protein